MFVHKLLFYQLIIIIVILNVTFALDQNCPRNNACPTYLDYFIKDFNPRCHCVPNIGKDTDVVVSDLIGNSETHEVTTEDGYILKIFRMPQKKNPKGVVVLIHPVSVSSRVWVTQGNESTALWFWQQGYDIWMVNNRGTMYGKKHVNLSPKDEKFWDFSFHEIGYYDHKAQFDYIYEKTKTKLILVGHSMSTTTTFVYSALRPAEAEKIVKLNVAMTPVTGLKHIRSPLKFAAKISRQIETINKLAHSYSYFGYDSRLIKFIRFAFDNLPLQFIVLVVLNATFGWTLSNARPDLFTLIIQSGFSEFSWKIMYHYAQIRNNNNSEFRMYDYGKKQNMKLYGEEIPPLYPLENITIPTYLMTTYNDTISTIKDSEIMYNRLSDKAKIYGYNRCTGVSHIDHHFGKNRKSKIFDRIIRLINQIS